LRGKKRNKFVSIFSHRSFYVGFFFPKAVKKLQESGAPPAVLLQHRVWSDLIGQLDANMTQRVQLLEKVGQLVIDLKL
jgi:hypothetical protein